MQRKISILLAVIAALFFACHTTFAAAAGGEPEFIRALYDALGKSYDANVDVCSYSDIECDIGRHVPNQISYKIGLDGQGLSGSRLPDPANNLDIYEIDLGDNRGIKATLPDSWAKLTYLETLDLSGSGFYGQIPSSWNGMKNLRSVDLSNCFLCYTMPNWGASSMPFLTEVNFNSNQLRGFSNSFGSFSSTTNFELKLTGNNMCGCAPDSWVSTALKLAAEQGKAGSTSATCTGADCSGRPECKTDGASGAARMAVTFVAFVAVAVAAAL